MNRKKLTKYILIPIVVVGLFVSIGAGRNDFGMGKNMEIFFNIFKGVNLFYVDSVDNDAMIKRAADAMLSGLDPYTEYIPKEEVENFNLMLTGKYGGLGSFINKPYNSRYIVFDERTKGYPVDKAGVVAGDTILAINGESMLDAPADKVSSLMKGTPGTNVTLTIKKMKTGEVKDITFTRETILMSPIAFAGMLNDSVGYIAYTGFNEESAELFKEELLKLKSKHNLKALIIDLRSNGGGSIDEAVKMVSFFVPKGTLVTSLKGRIEESERVYKTTTPPVDTDLKLAVLINNQSASASEIVAGALQDHDRAVILGNRSFGKGLVQRPQNVGYGAMLKVTIAKYYIPSGRCIQALDYSHKTKDGKAGYTPDSLRKEFRTTNNRKVFDGGGISPDITVEPEYINIFPASIIARGYFNSFANIYYKNNEKTPDPRKFQVSDQTFREFVEFVKDKPIEFTSISEKNLEKLVESAKKEQYYDKIKTELEEIQKVLTMKNTLKLLEENKKVISGLLADEIVSRYLYSQGRIEHSIQDDPYVLKALETVANTKEYKNILGIR